MLILILAKSLTVDPHNCWPLNVRMSVPRSFMTQLPQRLKNRQKLQKVGDYTTTWFSKSEFAGSDDLSRPPSPKLLGGVTTRRHCTWWFSILSLESVVMPQFEHLGLLSQTLSWALHFDLQLSREPWTGKTIWQCLQLVLIFSEEASTLPA